MEIGNQAIWFNLGTRAGWQAPPTLPLPVHAAALKLQAALHEKLPDAG